MWGKIGSELLCFHLCSYIFPTNHRFTLILSMCIQSPWNGYLKLYLLLIFSLTICCNMPIFEFFINIVKMFKDEVTYFMKIQFPLGAYPKKWKAQRPSPTCRMNMQKENCPTCFNENISLIHNRTFISNVITYVDKKNV